MTRRPWWQGAAIYQIYVRSWRDSNGDGIGDLRGVIEGLDYLSWLGIDGIWLSPTMPSPNRDWGYDVSDYYGVHPDLGSEADLVELLSAASDRGISVLLDLVPNHTSDQHPWFIDALSGPDAEHRSYYVWAEPGPGGSPPNNWHDATGKSAWTYDEASGQYYLHNFLPTQPDLDWWNPAVRSEMEGVLKYWFDLGVAGFRIDVAHGLIKDAGLRDNPPVTDDDHPLVRRWPLRPTYNVNRPEVHEIYRSWRAIAAAYSPERLLLGETWVLTPEEMAAYYGNLDELQLAFNFTFLFAELDAQEMASVVARTFAAIPGGGCAVWAGSNHDVSRFPTRWADGHQSRARLALALICLLPGTAVLYYGDEIGMVDVEVPPDQQLDEMVSEDGGISRDRCRTPMRWEGGDGVGFTSPGVVPWLPTGGPDLPDVASQAGSPDSMLTLCRALLALRKGHLSDREYLDPSVRGQLWTWTMAAPKASDGRRLSAAAANMSDQEAWVEIADLVGASFWEESVNGATATKVLSTYSVQPGDGDQGVGPGSKSVRLAPWELAVVEVAPN